MSYEVFAKFYDEMCKEVAPTFIKFIKSKVKKYKPKAESILELACGTGNVLIPLANDYNAFGLDLSKQMLNVAKKKKSKVKKFIHADMTNFKIDKKFDVVFCVFDSINHLLKFSDWKKMFRKVKEHLKYDGLFLFDMNTLNKIKYIKSESPRLRLITNSNGYNVNKTYVKNNTAVWEEITFLKKKGNIYTMHKELIKEKSFPIRNVKKALNKYYKILEYDRNKKQKRVYFTCRKK